MTEEIVHEENKTADFFHTHLMQPLWLAIQEAGYEAPTAIQSASIPPLLEGRDLLGQAQTGTGKTAAFALPMLQRIDLSLCRPQGIVLTPTRELALQVAETMQMYARHLKGIRILPVYGGQGMAMQLRQLASGVHIVVGTPGRIIDHLERGTLCLDAITTVILDEADEMLKMGFLEDVETILKRTPEHRQIALFSATIPPIIRDISKRHLHTPVEIHIKEKTATVATVTQRYFRVFEKDKTDALIRLLEVEDFDAVLIFARTRVSATELADTLHERGYDCGVLNGDMSQIQRENAIERLKRGLTDIIVATDVAARGLDVERITHVINFDIPADPETYVHRIGRTGRAGRDGQAILLLTPREMPLLRIIERATRQPLTAVALPSRSIISKRRISRFQRKLTQAIETQDLSFYQEMLDAYQQKHDIPPAQIAAALAFLLQQEHPLCVDETHFPEIIEPQERPPPPFSKHRSHRTNKPNGKSPYPAGKPSHPSGKPAHQSSKKPDVAANHFAKKLPTSHKQRGR